MKRKPDPHGELYEAKAAYDELIKEEQQVFTEVTAAQAELRTLRLQVQAAKRRWDKAADKVV